MCLVHVSALTSALIGHGCASSYCIFVFHYRFPTTSDRVSDSLLLHKTLYRPKAVKLLLTLLELPVEVC